MARRESLNGLAELTGFARQTVKRQLAHLTPVKQGRSHLYDTTEALPAIYSTGTGSVYETDKERARLLHHQANIAALDEEVKRKTLIPMELVIDEWQQTHANVRARLLALPTTLAATCAESPQREVERRATELVKQALEELAKDVDY